MGTTQFIRTTLRQNDSFHSMEDKRNQRAKNGHRHSRLFGGNVAQLTQGNGLYEGKQ